MTILDAALNGCSVLTEDIFGVTVTAGHIFLSNMNSCNSMNNFQKWLIMKIITDCVLCLLIEGRRDQFVDHGGAQNP